MKHSIAGIMNCLHNLTSINNWILLLYAGVLSCGVAYTLQIVGQKGLHPTVASLLMSMESVFSVLAGWIILGQTMSAREIFGCIFIFVAIVLAGSLTRAIYRPIKKLTDTVEQVGEGDLSLRAEVETGDEIGILCREFNVMLDDIQELIQKVIEEERLKKDAELEALQYQITPHFMYNTLNSIKFAALIRGEKELGGLIGDFVELLQATISKKGTFLTVADEFHILNNYVHLQEFRYQGSFRVRYEMEEGAGGCYIPRLILQPLVENAILHGIDMKEKMERLF